ncbi:hypothetical protein ABFS82_04G158700 [Erythranthe guttata]|uniref:BHLH domain-containing protein n=1 Tax=Erythranthe guttata TaxID=4155 RepID=A0A022Q6U6_ERYGU|nr:PREDICTED: transcription factor bHLH47-like [Erythranthe guttata]EYU24387.1 hypothetical protein MIMGU_mgv1a012721mg [Erythranthe guttata]|eukprot:XP_012853013.1 PREDICTED: transcription factor bHLH47-like [Erythranthe guttata]
MHSDTAPVVTSKMAMETSTSGDHSSKKNKGKVPKRIHKSEREKMKREHLNELFLALANSLELPDEDNSNGKASLLTEATRLVKEMLTQIDSLKKENAALLSESQYVTVEKNELKDETSTLAAQIGELQTELKSRVSDSELDLNVVPPEYHNHGAASHGTTGGWGPLAPAGHPQVQIVSPLQFAALCSNIQAYSEVDKEQTESSHISTVSKPHARYPTPADKWPSQVLENQPVLGKRGSGNSN